MGGMKEWTAEEVRAFRDSLKMSREAMARELGISMATVVRWEAGSFAPSPVMKRLLNDLERQKSEGAL